MTYQDYSSFKLISFVEIEWWFITNTIAGKEFIIYNYCYM